MTEAITRDYGLGPHIAEDQYAVLRHIVDNLHPHGTALEFGVASGTSLRIIAARMPAVGFDSWKGLPEDWGPFPQGSWACDPPTIANSSLVAGMFADTLPLFDFAALGPIGLVHFDADLYSTTTTILKYVGPHLQAGCYCIFDEWHGQPYHADHEERAWREYAEDSGITWDVVGHDNEAWAIQIA
ncbi:TylF/MycF/NovP-related O-methyltransferase [Mycobacterium sp.]|uniref:TylF/MycF/NovP-related O-methyltransferase n=1 Tax=Mycobacterium sp. TaxID=1785 RepID=UPI003F946FA8